MKKKMKKSHKKTSAEKFHEKHNTRGLVATSKDKYKEAFERWKSGTPLSAIAREMVKRRREIKLEFIKLAGGKEQFKALRDAGAGGKAFGGKRAGGRTKEVVLADDSKVKKVVSSPRWKIESVWEPCTVRIKDEGLFSWRKEKLRIFISPKGNKYVKAKEMEKADLLVEVRAYSLPDKSGKTIRLPKCDTILRLKKLANSSLLRKLKEEDKLVKRGLKALKHRKKIKKAKREARKAAKVSSKKSK